MDSKFVDSCHWASKLTITTLLGATLALQGCNTVTSNVQKDNSANHDYDQTEMNDHASRAFDELDGKTPRPLSASSSPPSSKPKTLKAKSSVKEQTLEPSWVMTPPQSHEWIYGVGSAPINSSNAIARQLADDQAKVNLASNLRISVSGLNTSQESVKSGVVSQSFSSEVRNTVAAVSLTGLTVTERYIDEKQKTVFSLAALNKQAAISNLSQQIITLDTELMALKNDLQIGTPIERLRRALPALKKLEQRKQLNQQALDISNSQKVFPLPSELSSLNIAIFALLDNLNFSIVSKGDPIFRDGLVKALTEQGMRIGNQQAADIILDYRIDWRAIHRDGKAYQFANANINLRDNSGKTLSNFSQKAKGVSSNADLAKDKALSKLALGLGNKLAENLLKAID